MNKAQRRVIAAAMGSIDTNTREGRILHEEYREWLAALDEQEEKNSAAASTANVGGGTRGAS